MTTLPQAYTAGGILRHKQTRQAVQLRQSTISYFDQNPDELKDYEIELPKSGLYAMDKMDAAGMRELRGNPCERRAER